MIMANIGNPVKNKLIVSEALASSSGCPDCMACDPCPCPHITLASLVKDKDSVLYIWNDGGAFATGTKDEFEAACTAAKEA